MKRKAKPRLPADSAREDTSGRGVVLKFCDQGAYIHAPSGNNCNPLAQGKIVLMQDPVKLAYTSAVADTFNTALLWHMDRHGTGVAELSRATGVSLGAIKQMRARPDSSTSAENAVAIARFYGKSVSDFIECVEAQAENELARMLDLLTPEERAILAALVRGMLASPAKR